MFYFVVVAVLVSMGLLSTSEDLFVFEYYCWENGIIPYYIDEGFPQEQVDLLHQTIAIFHSDTCLRWVDYTPQEIRNLTPKHHLEFLKVNYGRCRTSRQLHSNGSVVTFIKMLDMCFSRHVLLHEMMHALGFRHEHQRSDRNCYVVIKQAVEHLPDFKINAQEPWLERYPYDKYSIMHYSRSFLMKSRREGRRYRTDFLGNAYGQLTHLDLNKVLYKFCGGQHYCDVNPEDCRVSDVFRQARGCISHS